MGKRHKLLLALCAAVTLLPPASAAARPAAAVPFTLTDQNARVHVITYPRDKVSVLVLSDQNGSSQIAGWISPIYARYEERIDIAGLADLPGIPPIFHGLFRREFKKRLTYPVMLDWSGEVAKTFGYRGKQAHVFVIGTRGQIVSSQTGAASPAALAEVYRAVDQLQSER